MGRSPCCENEHTNKGAWTKEEDQRLINYINSHGGGSWRSLPKAAGLQRCGKSCRLRWINYLRPDLKRGNFTKEEDELIISLHSLLGNKWSLIATRMPGRTDNEIKNYWNTHIKRKLISRGIDPQTHRFLNSSTTPTTNASSNKTSNYTNNDNFQLINMQGSTLHFGMAMKLELDFSTRSTSDPNDAIPIIRSSSFSEDSNSSIVTNEDAYGEINLELSMSLPSPSKLSTNEMKNQEQQLACQMIRTSSNISVLTKGGVCLCYNLGNFNDKGGCNLHGF